MTLRYTFPPGLKIDFFFLIFRFRWFHALLYSINTHLVMMNVLWWPLFTRSFLTINSKMYCPFLREILSLYFRAGKWKLVLTFSSMKNFFKPIIYWNRIPSPAAHLLLCRHQKVRCVSYDCLIHTKHFFLTLINQSQCGVSCISWRDFYDLAAKRTGSIWWDSIISTDFC